MMVAMISLRNVVGKLTRMVFEAIASKVFLSTRNWRWKRERAHVGGEEVCTGGEEAGVPGPEDRTRDLEARREICDGAEYQEGESGVDGKRGSYPITRAASCPVPVIPQVPKVQQSEGVP